MSKYSLYNLDIWNRFSNKWGKSEKEFQLKTYPQFDPFFNFFKRKNEIQELVSDPTLQKVSQHSFTPFVKILTKTPRYKLDKETNSYDLETKIRPIAFASHFDTYLYSFYSFALTEKYQEYIHKNGFQECVLAYRTDLDGKCNIQFAKDVFDDVKSRLEVNKNCSTIGLDISGYFDNIDHKVLKEKWCKILSVKELPDDQYKIFRSLTKYNYVSRDSILKHFKVDLEQRKKNGQNWQTLLDLVPNELKGSSYNDKFDLLRERKLIVTNLPKRDEQGNITFRGIPQGSPMSALLSNIYLIDFDSWLFELSKKESFTYRRYCDDIMIICETNNAKTLNEIIENEIKKYSLKIQAKKTELIEFKVNSKNKIRGFNKKKINENKVVITSDNEQKYYKNLQYLGFEFNGQNIYIRPGSLSRYFRKMKGRIVKTIMMSYSDKSKFDNIRRKQMYDRYSHLGKRNFITYAQNASKKEYKNSAGIIKNGLDSISIKRQIAAHFSILEKEVIKTSKQRADQKEKQGKLKVVKF